ncbi:DNA repair protein-like protein [Chaetomium strumarium]|uniref:DNA repair protein-like protein n=1 Tax=Chaetomium strumarium TaxID=1170767 RepID=A0AAJ0GQQ6_9PEZI|nr:DNA repair protein-like protein [Chaetomium strumarium]
MTDLLRVLPHFPVGQFARLIPVLEKHAVSTSDLLSLEAADIGKRTRLPLLDVKRLCSAVLDALHSELGVSTTVPRPRQQAKAGSEAGPGLEGPNGGGRAAPEQFDAEHTPASSLGGTAASLSAQWQTISTLDGELDRALGGGIPAGYVTEVTGESGAGKTQFLLTLLLSAQLPPPHGLGRPALYISTEAPLSTRRLTQMLSANPLFQRLPPSQRPSLDNIISTVTPDLESQDHILTFQVPVEVERRGIGLLVVDSVAANYRAEFERSGGSQHGSNMGVRTAELVKLGMHLRDLAQRHNLAVVVSNQVADRFSSGSSSSGITPSFQTPASSLHRLPPQPQPPRQTQESPLATRSRAPPQPQLPPSSSVSSSLPSSSLPQQPPPPPPLFNPDETDNNNTLPQQPSHPALLLDHQQRWFTGWGDEPSSSPSLAAGPLKTPSLGLVWTTQVAGRIALFRRPAAYTYQQGKGGWRRWMKVVFASHVAGTGPGLEGAVEFEVWMGGLRSTSASGMGVESGDGNETKEG